jgi:class 3 adenylate cyclase
MESSEHKCRMDFTIEVIRTDDATRMASFTLVPDGRRYNLIERDGEKFYLDKYLSQLISVEDMKSSMVRQLPGLPMFALSPSIKSTPEYAATRRSAIVSDAGTGQYTPPKEQAIPHQPFTDDPKLPRDIAFLSIDICGSSAQRHADAEAFERAYKILLRELGTVVGLFNGAILKPTGDGFIALIDYPAFTCQCDASIDMGLSLIRVLHDSVNPALKELGLAALKIRIGADYGPAELRHLDVPATGFSEKEVASDALNRAAKIEKSCGANEFRIGRRLYELIHVQWLERAKEVSFDGVSVGMPGYKVYQVT